MSIVISPYEYTYPVARFELAEKTVWAAPMQYLWVVGRCSGQSNYAAANAALEAHALMECGRGVSSTAIQWGAWAAGDLVCSQLDLVLVLAYHLRISVGPIMQKCFNQVIYATAVVLWMTDKGVCLRVRVHVRVLS